MNTHRLHDLTKKGPQYYARNRFRVGDRVQFTAEGLAQFSTLRVRTGVVIGFSREADNLVRIRRGPKGQPEVYHVDLLERCEEPT